MLERRKYAIRNCRYLQLHLLIAYQPIWLKRNLNCHRVAQNPQFTILYWHWVYEEFYYSSVLYIFSMAVTRVANEIPFIKQNLYSAFYCSFTLALSWVRISDIMQCKLHKQKQTGNSQSMKGISVLLEIDLHSRYSAESFFSLGSVRLCTTTSDFRLSR